MVAEAPRGGSSAGAGGAGAPLPPCSLLEPPLQFLAMNEEEEEEKVKKKEGKQRKKKEDGKLSPPFYFNSRSAPALVCLLTFSCFCSYVFV